MLMPALETWDDLDVEADEFEDGTPGVWDDAWDISPTPWQKHNADEEFVCADFSQIESRVIAWLAGQIDLLDVFRRNDADKNQPDVYVYTAGKIGSKNRQLGKVCVLGLGFGMGPDKFVTTAKIMGGLTITLPFAIDTVREWRAANDKIVQFWYDLDDAFRKAIAAPYGSRFQVGYVTIVRGRTAVAIELPSGHHQLIYRNARLEPDPKNKFHGTSITYDGVNQYTKKWGPVRTYGGKLAENVTQAVARDMMAHCLLILDSMGIDQRMTVHDEIIAVAKTADAARILKVVLTVMQTPPRWAVGFPMAAAGWHGRRYRK
jgi:DNA polymerase